MISNDLFSQSLETFIKLNNQLTQIQKKPIPITDEISLSTSALHLLEVINNYPDSTMTQLANKLGVTKGSISQQLPKLISLSLITVKQTQENKKSKLISLTERGKDVNSAHESLHKELYKALKEDLGTISSEDIKTVLKVMDKISSSINRYQTKLN